MSFVHLHVHTEYSLRDATCSIGELFRRAENLRMPAIAITDHNSLAGVPSFLKHARLHPKVKPIVGCEVCVESNGQPYHLILLAKNLQGYRNLVKLVSRAFIGSIGLRDKPCIERSELEVFKEGLICCSGCTNGEIPRHICNGEPEAAEEAIVWYKDTFADDFYLEVMKHPSAAHGHNNEVYLQQCVYTDLIFRLAEKYGIKVIATNDVHFLRKDDATKQQLLISMKYAQNDGTRPYYTGEEYLKSEKNMRGLFSDHPEVIDNTLDVTSKIEIYDISREIELPEYPLPEKERNKVQSWMRSYSSIIDAGAHGEDGLLRDDSFFSSMSYLCHLVFNSAKKKYGKPLLPDVKKRLETELKAISMRGLADLFLIIWDFTNWAQKNNISLGPGRGSSPGSIVLYCLGVTSIDPLQYGLLFERFMNPELPDFPDIDLDIEEDGRTRLFRYLSDQYGWDHVGLVCVYGSVRPGHPRYNKRLDGIVCMRGIHACRILLSRQPLHEYLPLNIWTDEGGGAYYPVSQYSGEYCSETGVLPLDLINLQELTYFKECIRLIKIHYGESIDLSVIPLNDSDTFSLYGKGETEGIFHCMNPEASIMVKKLKPVRLEDLMMIEALQREKGLVRFPKVFAARKGDTGSKTGIPEVDTILAETGGIPLYQEQVMVIAQKIAGFTPAYSNILRKVLARNNSDMLEEMHRDFVVGGLLESTTPDILETLWCSWCRASAILFNKSHAACYALLGYRAAWLKTHYPKEFAEAFQIKTERK